MSATKIDLPFTQKDFEDVPLAVREMVALTCARHAESDPSSVPGLIRLLLSVAELLAAETNDIQRAFLARTRDRLDAVMELEDDGAVITMLAGVTLMLGGLATAVQSVVDSSHPLHGKVDLAAVGDKAFNFWNSELHGPALADAATWLHDFGAVHDEGVSVSGQERVVKASTKRPRLVDAQQEFFALWRQLSQEKRNLVLEKLRRVDAGLCTVDEMVQEMRQEMADAEANDHA